MKTSSNRSYSPEPLKMRRPGLPLATKRLSKLLYASLCSSLSLPPFQTSERLGIFLSSFLLAELDEDARMRCSYNIGGSASGKSAPKTYRLSSSENAFGGGANLQTIPSEKSKSLNKAKARGTIALLGDPYAYPNLRTMFIPDEGKTFFDGDLDRADLQVVCWEANDEMLKIAPQTRSGYPLNECLCPTKQNRPPLEELVEGHPKYSDHRGPLKALREFAKTFCHGTNYGGQPKNNVRSHWMDCPEKLNVLRESGLEHILVLKSGTKELSIKCQSIGLSRIDLASDGISSIDLILSSPKLSLGFPSQPSASPSTESGKPSILTDSKASTETGISKVSLQTHDSLSGQFPTEKKRSLGRRNPSLWACGDSVF